jgi:hypothetical protein
MVHKGNSPPPSSAVLGEPRPPLLLMLRNHVFRHLVGLLGRGISPSEDLNLHRTTQHRKTRTIMHSLSGIRTHDPSIQAAKTDALDRACAVVGQREGGAHMKYSVFGLEVSINRRFSFQNEKRLLQRNGHIACTKAPSYIYRHSRPPTSTRMRRKA